MLDVAAANTKNAQKVQARAYNAKHARNAFAVGEKVWRMNLLWSTKLKALRKGPKWVGPYEIVDRKGGGNSNYVLKCLSSKNKPPAPLHACTPSVSSMSPHVCTPSDQSPTLPHVCTPFKSIPGHTPSSSIPPAHSDETMSAAQILADLTEGSVEQLEAEPEPEAEEQVVFEDQTLKEIDIDILVSGVQRPTAIKFKPLSLFCRKPAGARLDVHVGKQKGLKGIVA